MRLTVSDKKTLKSIIIDEIVEANDKIISSDQLQEEAEKLANKQLEPDLSRHQKLEEQQDSINDEIGELSDKIQKHVEKLTGERVYNYGSNRFTNLNSLVNLEIRKLEIKYKLIPVPKESDVEKLIVKIQL